MALFRICTPDSPVSAVHFDMYETYVFFLLVGYFVYIIDFNSHSRSNQLKLKISVYAICWLKKEVNHAACGLCDFGGHCAAFGFSHSIYVEAPGKGVLRMLGLFRVLRMQPVRGLFEGREEKTEINPGGPGIGR